jgi:hypothetical protein
MQPHQFHANRVKLAAQAQVPLPAHGTHPLLPQPLPLMTLGLTQAAHQLAPTTPHSKVLEII